MMNRNDARSTSPRRLSTLGEVTEPNDSIYGLDRRSSLRTLSTINHGIPKDTVYYLETARIVQMTRAPQKQSKFKRYQKNWWFWPTTLATIVLLILVLVGTFLSLWDHGHMNQSTETIGQGVYTTSTTMTAAAVSAVQESCTSGSCIAPVESTSAGLDPNVIMMTASPTSIVEFQKCAAGPCSMPSTPTVPPTTFETVMTTSEITLPDLSGRYSTTTAITKTITAMMMISPRTTGTRSTLYGQGQANFHGTSKAAFLTRTYPGGSTVEQRRATRTPLAIRREAVIV